MKHFLRKLLRRSTLLVLLGLVVLLTLLALALLGRPWPAHGTVPAGLVVAAALAGLGWWLCKRWRAHRAAARLEQALDGDMERAVRTQADRGEPDAQELRRRLQEVLRIIKRSSLGRRGGRAALYELPWYMVIGPSSAGKSTAVVQSGLNFPFPHGRDNILRGIGGTRDCDWFFTSEGILLDTAGRYAVEPEQRGEWLAFLALLKQHRPLAPINGIVVATGVTTLRDMAPEQLLALARDLRGRVQELTDVLEVCAPVYLLFTKADLIPGFTDFFAGYDAQEREQVWGATLPYQADAGTDAVALFDRHFAELREGLKEVALARMGLQHGQAQPTAVLSFPLAFAALQPALRAFVATLFDENVFQVRPVFRGFYFTSAVQPGDTAAPDRSGVAERFALAPPEQGAAAPAPAEQGYFLKELFSKVIFADRHLVRRHASPARQRLRTWSYAGGVLALAGVLALWSWSYAGNRQLVAGVQADLDKALRLQDGRADLASRLQALELLQDRVEALAAWRARRPWSVGLGLYQGEALELRLRQEYFQGLRRVMLEPVAQALESYLAEVNRHADALRPAGRAPESGAQVAAATVSAPAATGPDEAPSPYAQASATDVEDAYKALKTYLMLAERARMEPGHLTDQITRFWRGWLEEQRGTLPREQLMRSAERLISFSMTQLQDPLFPVITTHFGLVDEVREHLRRVVQGTPAIERVYADIKARASTRYAPMTVLRIVGEQDKALVGGSHVVPGTFTREAWQGYVEPAIREAAHDALQSSDWVLKTSTRDDLSLQGSPEQVRRTLTERYKAEYAREWQRFMQGVAVAEFGGFDAAVARMDRLGDPLESPIRKLLLTLAAQTTWDQPSAPDPRAALLREGLAEWVKQSAQRLMPPATVDALTAKPEAARADGGDAAPGAVGREFAALPRLLAPRDGGGSLLDGYLQQLGRLRSRLHTIHNQGDAGPGARALMAATFEGNGSELSEALRFVEEQMLAGAGESARATLKPLLVRPLMQSFAVLVRPAETDLNRLWAAQALQSFQQTLAGKYPFEPASRVEAAPAEIARVFGPSGAVARFATEALGPLVTRRGDDLTPRQWAQMGLRLRPAFAQGFNTWVAVLDGAAGGAGGPGSTAAPGGAAQTSFQLLPLSVPGFIEYTVEIDGQALRYRNGPARWTSFVWPGAGPALGVRISGITLDGRTLELFSAPGAYGFERLIDAAQVTKLPDGVRELRWGEEPQAIALQYRAVTSPGPAAGAASRSAARGLRGLALPALVAGEDGAGPATVAVATASGAAR